ncbi:MAG: hypothetical protein AAF242_13495 [Bacteroidota bacterium]
MMRYRLLFGIFLTLFASLSINAQNFDNVDSEFECASISELLQTFELSGTKSTALVSMMRSIGRDPIDSGFDQQIITELAKRPWRIESIKNLEADFLVILGQFNARIIDEDATRQRLACELAKYLHKDYLINFDRESIFSPPSQAFKFYTGIREQGLWRNLIDEETGEMAEPEQSTPSFDFLEEDSNNDETPTIVPEAEKGLSFLTFLYYLVLGIGAWILLSLLLGIVIGDQRFKNPTTQQIASFILIPFQLIRPVLTANSTRTTGSIRELKPKNYATEISEEQIKRFIDERVIATQANQITSTTEGSPIHPELDRIQELELAVAALQKGGDLSNNVTLPIGDNEDIAGLMDQLQFKIEMLEKKLDLFRSDLDRLQEAWGSGQTGAGAQLDLAPIRKLITQELADYDLALDKRIKALEEKGKSTIDKSKPTSPIASIPTESPGLSIPPTTTPLPQQIEFEIQKEKEEEEDFLELPTLPKKDSPIATPTQYIWYASSPQKGLFYGRRLETGFVAKQTVYKIIIDKAKPKQATFTLVDDEATVRLAMNIPDSYILPAMELHGPGKLAEAQEIGPVEPGKLEKEGENWRIVKKGVLHYH